MVQKFIDQNKQQIERNETWIQALEEKLQKFMNQNK